MVFSCEYCEIFKNTYFEEHLQTAASFCLKITKELRTTKASVFLKTSEGSLPNFALNIMRI